MSGDARYLYALYQYSTEYIEYSDIDLLSIFLHSMTPKYNNYEVQPHAYSVLCTRRHDSCGTNPGTAGEY